MADDRVPLPKLDIPTIDGDPSAAETRKDPRLPSTTIPPDLSMAIWRPTAPWGAPKKVETTTPSGERLAMYPGPSAGGGRKSATPRQLILQSARYSPRHRSPWKRHCSCRVVTRIPEISCEPPSAPPHCPALPRNPPPVFLRSPEERVVCRAPGRHRKPDRG